ncbi:class I poly(R)-hydroxyalkanoic acid synthase [Sphingomonas sp. RP10(2022)]|uniref:Class I poly(R)-hydroxyalkanoic acid synthase n=1 Tax=Sphingomonas liriopis TaxID=2949094 RepID=A0A9X2KUK4_9SPHN|nr:class I poly(R)-hydroxyalkanoic acid synthase [Sphingomonas liriopis]MCP3736078.1 class I poly(R)-hydroxyalkanoic acid synthase [Sphingomonas liriopis]
MADQHDDPTRPGATPDLADLQHWTWVMGRAQQMMMEQGLGLIEASKAAPGAAATPFANPALVRQAQDFWQENIALWQRLVDPAAAVPPPPQSEGDARDRRFKAAAWREDPWFDWIRRSYNLIADHMLRGVDALDGVPEKQKEQLRFAARGLVDAMSPSNFAMTNPEVVEKTIETRGQNLLDGLKHMLADIGKGQLTHTAEGAFEVGRNLATTPGKVVKRTPLYELIQYTPTTERVGTIPLVIFPPWINRFYILDLTPEKSFIRWAVEQGITVFMVSWKSADASLKDVVWDDYIAAQVDAIDTVRGVLDVPAVHTVGYCVAGTTLAATLALLAARGEASRVASATFFTAQVDFAQAGELQHFVTDDQLALIGTLSPQGFLDGRYMALTFNLLRGRDLIWNYVTNNYLLGSDYAPFDLLHWNGDTTNLPAKWHLSYLTDLYRDNLLVQPGAMSVAGEALDLTRVTTPAYVQAGREDHIAPAESVWKITHLFQGPLRFVLAGSGHIAGVVNPPAAGKYQYWTNESGATTLADFVAGATETKGSWWPDWLGWLRGVSAEDVVAEGARLPGEGALPALGEAPGEYVRAR